MKSIILAALLCSTALITPKPAQAGPLIGALSFLVGGGGFGAVTSVFGFAAGTVGFTIATTALRLGGSLLLSAAARALGPKAPKPPGAPELIRELQAPISLPPKRFVYGEAQVYGSPIWRVKGAILYGALILNSRPSDAITGLSFDKRPCALTGDMYDLAGPGATASAVPFAGHVTVWCGLGDQSAAPAVITTEAPALFSATDIGEGLTVMWLRLDAGDNSTRADRWPRTPPEVEVQGRWSLVYDPRDVAQDADDPVTWEWSANQALCVLDAARMNPIRNYPLAQIHLESFIDAADVADEAVALKAGGTEPRYEVNGALIFNGSEVMDQLMPLFAAGASEPVRVGGRLGIAPGAYTAPIATLTDITEAEGLDFQTLKPGRDLATTVRCTFTDKARDWRTSELNDYTVPGAQDADGGALTTIDLDLPLVTSASQAMRVQKISAHRQRAQRQITCTLPPSAFKLVAGCNAAVDFPAPYSLLNGVYRGTSANPGLWAGEESGGGVAMRVPVVLEETTAATYAWNPATEEQTRLVVALDLTRTPPEPGGVIATTTGAAVAVGTGAGATPAIRFAFDPSPSPSVIVYEWQYRLETAFGFLDFWTEGGSINADIRDASGKVHATLFPAQLYGNHQIRVRAVGRSASAWVLSAAVIATLEIPRYVADFEDASYQLDSVPGVLGNVISVARAGAATFVSAAGLVQSSAANVTRIDHLTGVPCLLVEPAGGNDWTYSEDISNAAWTKIRATVTANATTAADGATTADKLVEDTSTNTHYLRRARTFVSGVRADFVLHAKASERSVICVIAVGTGMATQRIEVNLSTGVATTLNGTPAVAVSALASGWYRIEFGFVAPASASGFFDLQLVNGTENYTGDGTSGAFVWGLQDGAGSYVATVASTVTRAADVPAMQGITATLDLIATYADTTTAIIDNAPVLPGYWPTLTQTRLRSLVGTI